MLIQSCGQLEIPSRHSSISNHTHEVLVVQSYTFESAKIENTIQCTFTSLRVIGQSEPCEAAASVAALSVSADVRAAVGQVDVGGGTLINICMEEGK